MQKFWSRDDGATAHGEARDRPNEDARDEPVRGYRGAFRPFLAATLTAILIVAFGVFGGPGYASSVGHGVTAVAKALQISTSAHDNSKGLGANVTSQSTAKAKAGSSGHDDEGDDHDQYKPGHGCGDKNHVHSGRNECHGHGGP